MSEEVTAFKKTATVYCPDCTGTNLHTGGMTDTNVYMCVTLSLFTTSIYDPSHTTRRTNDYNYSEPISFYVSSTHELCAMDLPLLTTSWNQRCGMYLPEYICIRGAVCCNIMYAY